MENTDWISFDCNKIPKPFNYTSGGWWFVVQNLGIHGERIQPCWWTGSKFLGVNNTSIIKVKKVIFPKL